MMTYANLTLFKFRIDAARPSRAGPDATSTAHPTTAAVYLSSWLPGATVMRRKSLVDNDGRDSKISVTPLLPWISTCGISTQRTERC